MKGVYIKEKKTGEKEGGVIFFKRGEGTISKSYGQVGFHNFFSSLN